MRRVLVVLVILASLSACGSQALIANYKLRDVDPLTTPAADLRVALEVPQAFQPRADRIAMTGTLTRSDAPRQTARFALVPAQTGPLEQALAAQMSAGDRLHVYRIAPDRLEAFDRFRAEAQAARASGATGQGTLTVDSPVCSNTVSLPDRVPVTVHLKVGEVADYVTLIRDGDVTEDTEGTNLLPRCE